jgi:ubiquinone/menaquinone biosynthesis C-methylase UbiE
MAAVASGYARSGRKQEAWGGGNRGNELMLDEVMSALERAAGPELRGIEPILEIGCGTGSWLSRLAGAGVAPDRLHGIDLLEERVREARERVPGAHVSVGNARALELPDRRFALTLLFVVLSSLPSREAEADALREARRVTVPGGLVAVYDMRAPSPNRHVHRVPRAWLRSQLPGETTFRSLTLVPQISRGLGGAADRLYAPLARVPFLRTHWLALHRVR